jgi:predicted acyltransferase
MNQRYYSLDVFRGATVALMILVNNPGSWAHIYPPLDHASWHGCTPTDLVFPFFLFAVGNAMAFVMPKFEKEGTTYFLKKVIKRAILIFCIGLFLNWSPFLKWDHDQLVFKPWAFMNKDANGFSFEDGVRIFGVLQRIAICYLIAACLVYFGKTKLSLFISIGLLLGYWTLSAFLGNPQDPYSITGYFGRTVDISVLTKFHMLHIDKIDNQVYHFDYEGLASSVAAIVQVVFGFLVGQFIQQQGKNGGMLMKLLIAGAAITLVGFVWSYWFPLNKKMWTSSYALFTTGLAILTLGLLIFLIEFNNLKGAWSKFFDVFGKNPLFIFVLSGFLPRVLGLIRIAGPLNKEGKPTYLSPLGWFYEHVCKNITEDLRFGSMVYALIMIAFYWLIVYLMDKKKIYVKV